MEVDTPTHSTIENYTLGRTLGSGFSAKVKLAMNEAGERYALKIFRHDNPKFDAKQFDLLRNELHAAYNLDHKHVVKYDRFKQGAIMNKKDGTQVEVTFIAQEYIEGFELFDYVGKSGAFPEPICKFYFMQILQGINHIHSRGFAHRDLKIENIMIDMNKDVKIVDFGMAGPLQGRDGKGKLSTYLGTLCYMAPEILENECYQGQVVDFFALGVILFILYTGYPPFKEATKDDDYYKLIKTNRSDLFWQMHTRTARQPEDFYSEEFKDLLTLMFQFHPYKRLCFADIIGHPWVASAPAATRQEVQDEFFRRDQKLNEELMKEQQKKLLEKQKQTIAGTANGVHLGVCDDEVDDDQMEESEMPEHLETKAYNPEKIRNFAFFSTDPALSLMKKVKNILEEDDGKQLKLSADYWKGTFWVDNGVEESERTRQLAQIQVEISKVPGQEEKHCVEFYRKAGCSILSTDYSSKYIEDLVKSVNITMHEETNTENASIAQ